MSNQINQVNKNPLTYGKHPFTQVISAKIGSGKTYYLINLLKMHYLNFFDKIVIFCPTVNLDEKWDEINKLHLDKKLLRNDLQDNEYKLSNYIVYDNEDEYETKINELYTTHLHYGKIFDDNLNSYVNVDDKPIEPPKTLLIFDDISGIKSMTHGNLIQKLIRQSRHLNMSVIYSVQDVRSVSPSIRNNTRLLTLFKTFNEEELDKIYDAFTVPTKRKRFKEVLLDIFKNYDDFPNKKIDRPIILFNSQNKSTKHLVLLLENFYINF